MRECSDPLLRRLRLPALFLQLALHQTTRRHARLVEGERNQRGLGGVAVDERLLLGDDGRVFPEGEIDHAAIGLVDLGIIDGPVAHGEPEVMGGRVGLGREGVEHDMGGFAEGLVRPRRPRAKGDPAIHGRAEFEHLPTVDLVVEIARGAIDGGGVHIVHAPLGAHHVAIDLHLERRLGDAAARQRALVDEDHMGEIEDIVDHQLVITGDMQIALHGRPLRRIRLVEIRQQGFIDLVEIAHPDEHELVALDRRIVARAEIRSDGRVAGHMGAGALPVEADAVIAAGQIIAHDLARRERRLAMGAAVRQHPHHPIAAAIDGEGLVADHARKGLFADLGAMGHRVPLVAKERLGGHLMLLRLWLRLRRSENAERLR